MSININKYNQLSDYLSDNNKPTDESIVSQVDNGIVYQGVNVMLKGDQLAEDNVCVVVKDGTNNELLYIPIETYQAAKLDTTRYTVQNFILFGLCNRKKLYMYKNGIGNFEFAAPNRYRLECDTTDAGGFTWAVTINNSNKSGTVEWAANATLSSIAAQINAVVPNMASHTEGEDYIRISIKSYSNSTLTLTGNTGATLTDLSVYCKIGGAAQEETHRTWEAQSVSSLFPESGYLAGGTYMHARNGLNLSYRCGANLSVYKSYYRTNGSTAYIAENSVANRMSEAGFAALNGSDTPEAQALYDKYGGSWDAYMEASMVQLNDPKRYGMEFKSYDNGVSQNGFLASVMTLDFDMETWVPCYPAAYNASQTTIAGLPGCLPTIHQIALIFNKDRYNRIRAALTAIGGAANVSGNTTLLVAEYSSTYSWSYDGYRGSFINLDKSSQKIVRPVLAAD